MLSSSINRCVVSLHGVLCGLDRVPMRMLAVFMRAGGVPFSLFRVAVSVVVGSLVMMMSRGGVMRRSQHVLFMSRMCHRGHNFLP
ncbi:hypothetical protein [Methylobacterium sp. JK268]